MKHQTHEKIKPVAVSAKSVNAGRTTATTTDVLHDNNLTSLGNAIRTKEQADSFMQRLRSLKDDNS